ncbi:hypothetical protein HYFRA_00006937 [Hymenoscyphus fraxineus]|uniref:Alcohol dehydrogenase n=1 Tax=Hymenoscyphus fraxineus TaxID=746836 RepID=A0A9N9KNM3_9HELO|nr:hypothetical protein HYFRA_00006937 [Hymenoscyphus fraxineus]
MAELKQKMSAIKWEEKKFSVTVEKVDIPKIEHPLDSLIRITSSAICGTDLHTYNGRIPMDKHLTFGHENIGIVESIGSAVSTVKVGDRVVVCAIEHSVQSNGGSALQIPFGCGDYGLDVPQVDGGQAEFMRVPFADDNLLIVPSGKQHELDYLLLADIWPTAWFGLESAGQVAGDTVVVFGAGPVGLLAAYSALLRGAAKVYSVDRVHERLNMAKSIGAIPIDFSKSPADSQIMKLEPNGVDRSLDCVGFECVDSTGRNVENLVLTQAVNVTRVDGGIGLVGVWTTEDVGGSTEDEKRGVIPLPIGQILTKSLSIRGGPAKIQLYQNALKKLIDSGKAKPSFVFTDEVRIEDGPKAYRKFADKKTIKVVFRFDGH